MELAITAPFAGFVSGITLSPGDRVELGQALVVITPHEGAQDLTLKLRLTVRLPLRRASSELS